MRSIGGSCIVISHLAAIFKEWLVQARPAESQTRGDYLYKIFELRDSIGARLNSSRPFQQRDLSIVPDNLPSIGLT